MVQNKSRSIHVLTGATSGMGLHIAAELSGLPNAHIFAGVRDPQQAKNLRSAVPSYKLTVLLLDLDELDSVSVFAAEVRQLLSQSDTLASIICNAGLQILGPKDVTSAGVERTFQVNVLGHFLLVELLKERLDVEGSVITIGSGTHNAEDKLASRFGFRGGFFPDAAAVAAGDLGQSGPETQLGMDRYATSKLCAILYAHGMVGDTASPEVRYYAFDPGLMPGTGLARDRSMIEKFAWRYLLPVTRHLVSGVSSGKKSGKALVQLCMVDPRYESGSYVEFTGDPAPQSELAASNKNGRELIEYCRSLVSDYL